MYLTYPFSCSKVTLCHGAFRVIAQLLFNIITTLQMIKLDVIFFPVGLYIFYICVVVYLYGDLAIYAAAVPKSLRDVAWSVDLHLVS